MKNKYLLVSAIILVILLIDQWVKIWVKTNMAYGDDFQILGLNWAYIHFVENNGMAFGLSLGGEYGKLALSLFRIIAVGFLFYLIYRLIKENAGVGILVSFSLIVAGAMGNIIDSIFYGMIFSESPYHGGLAEIFPKDGGYAAIFHGKVVDMFYFPLIDTLLPDWVPFWGGERFQFFKPVFNVADSAICVGVVILLLFQRSFFSNKKESTADDQIVAAAAVVETDAELSEETNSEK